MPQRTFSCINGVINGLKIGVIYLDICDYWSQNITGFATKEGASETGIAREDCSEILEDN